MCIKLNVPFWEKLFLFFYEVVGEDAIKLSHMLKVKEEKKAKLVTPSNGIYLLQVGCLSKGVQWGLANANLRASLVGISSAWVTSAWTKTFQRKEGIHYLPLHECHNSLNRRVEILQRSYLAKMLNIDSACISLYSEIKCQVSLSTMKSAI